MIRTYLLGGFMSCALRGGSAAQTPTITSLGISALRNPIRTFCSRFLPVIATLIITTGLLPAAPIPINGSLNWGGGAFSAQVSGPGVDLGFWYYVEGCLGCVQSDLPACRVGSPCDFSHDWFFEPILSDPPFVEGIQITFRPYVKIGQPCGDQPCGDPCIREDGTFTGRLFNRNAPGLNGTGTLDLLLAGTATAESIDPGGFLSQVTFSGTATQAESIPEPPSRALCLIAAAVIAFAGRRK